MPYLQLSMLAGALLGIKSAMTIHQVDPYKVAEIKELKGKPNATQVRLEARCVGSAAGARQQAE